MACICSSTFDARMTEAGGRALSLTQGSERGKASIAES